MADVSVVFLGGPVDGLEMVLANDPVEFRFPQMQPFARYDPQQALPISYVAYRRTGRTINGRRIYALVIPRE